jgi:hypothetical protein
LRSQDPQSRHVARRFAGYRGQRGERAPSIAQAFILLREFQFGALEGRPVGTIVRESAAGGTTPLQQPTRGRSLARRFRG